ncbi:MAG TPA: histidine kinase, partial [Bacteroidales bacterium]|nr:histidine kinase [Bacteroidales bacterium]
IESYTKALMLGENMGDTLLIIKSVNNLGNVHLTLLYEWEKAEAFFNKSVLLARTIGFEQAELIGLNNLSQVYMNSGRENEALNVTRQMLELYPDNPYIYYNLANLYRQKQQTAKALGFYNTALELSVFETELKLILLMDMSEIYSELRDFENSMLFYRRFNQLRDSIHSIEALKSSKEIEARYENLKKEKEIFELNNKTLKAERSIGYIVFSAVTVGFLLIVLVLFVNQKKKIVQQKLKQSESEKLAVVAHAGLEGEEKERSRLAKELHDGLGGMLTAVQLEIETHNANTQPAHSNNSKSLNMLQQSIAELRRISNALLPEALLKTGLNNALKHYCLSFNLVSKSTEITYLFSGIETSFSKPFELTVYRICQELLNNAVKHSRATHVEVQLIVESNRVFLSVTDNGIGFDVESAMLNQSVGLKSIVQRVE